MADGSTTQPGAGRFAVRAPGRRPGRFGLMAGAVAIGLALIAGVSIGRLRSVSGIPDVGDPFDVAAARRPIDLPDEDNAYALYAEARGNYVGLSSTLWEDSGPLARERDRRSALIVRLAVERYRREQGQTPATAGALVGPDLDELPEGIEAGDPIPEVED